MVLLRKKYSRMRALQTVVAPNIIYLYTISESTRMYLRKAENLGLDIVYSMGFDAWNFGLSFN